MMTARQGLKMFFYILILLAPALSEKAALAGQAVNGDLKNDIDCGELAESNFIKPSLFPKLNRVWGDLKQKLMGYFVLWPDLRIIQGNAGGRQTLKICPPPGLSIYISTELASVLDGFDRSSIALVLSHELAHAYEHYGASDPPRYYSRKTPHEQGAPVISEIEMQADARGLFLLLLAGYEPPDFIKLSQNLQKMTGSDGPSSLLHIRERLSVMKKMMGAIRAIAGSFKVSVYMALMGDYVSALRLLEMVDEQTMLDIHTGSGDGIDAGVSRVLDTRMELPEVLLWHAIISVEKNRQCAVWVFGDSGDIHQKILSSGVPACRPVINTDFALGRESAISRVAPGACENVTTKTFSQASFLIEKAKWLGMNGIAADANLACTRFYAGEPGAAAEKLGAVLARKEIPPAVKNVLEENLKMTMLADCIKRVEKDAGIESIGICIRAVMGDKGVSRLSPYNGRVVKSLLGDAAGPQASIKSDRYISVKCKKDQVGYFDRKLMGGTENTPLEKVGTCPGGYTLSAVYPASIRAGKNSGYWQCSKDDGSGINLLAVVMPPYQEEGLSEQSVVLVEHRLSAEGEILKLDDWICGKEGPRMVEKAGEDENGNEVYSALFRGEDVLLLVRNGMVTGVVARAD